MDYKFKNYLLLEVVHELLNSFPFNNEVEKQISSMNLEGILKEYQPHSEIENDSVANAICWGISTLRSLLNKKPVRTLDEVLSFTNHILSEQRHFEVG